MRKWRRLSYSFTFVFAILLFLITSTDMKAQALPTAASSGELSAFATYSRVTTDYGYPNKGGATFGLLYVREVPWLLTPSIEFRVKATFDGRTVDEHTWGGGVRFERRILDFRPYGTSSSAAEPFTITFPILTIPTLLESPIPGTTPSCIHRVSALTTTLQSKGARFHYQFEFWNLGNS
jgi:hypothetical protein